MLEYLQELRDNWNNSYWRADHPEVMGVLLAFITGVIGLLFAWLETRIRVPKTSDV